MAAGGAGVPRGLLLALIVAGVGLIALGLLSSLGRLDSVVLAVLGVFGMFGSVIRGH